MINSTQTKLLALVLLFLSIRSSAQFYNSGEDPASIRWKQIKTDNFQVIFPSEFEREANRLANTLEYLYNQVSKTLNHKPRKISVILHSQSSSSNGVVTWAPKRMELFTTPLQDNYGQDWLDQLAVHELRHVVQIDKLNQGITEIAGILFGQQATGAVTGLIPRWFLEGDAVNNETALTSTGRGRSASFEMEMKTWVTTRNTLYSYEKALRGSYRDYIPDPYQLGYPMVAWVRKNYGSGVFSNDLDFVGQNPFTLFPFPIGLKKQMNLPSAKLYKTVYENLKQQWNNQISIVQPVEYTKLNLKEKKAYTNYQFPQWIDDTTLLAVKSGIDQLTEFSLLYKSGKEKKIHTPGSFALDRFSYSTNKFVWAEEIPDIRWPNRSYYCIKTGDLKTHRVLLLTKKTRYFAPSLSPDGKQIAAIEVTRQNECFLVILDSGTGKVLERIASPENRFLQMPAWTADNHIIILIATREKGKSIVLYDTEKKRWNTVVRPTFRNITQPADAGKYVVFVSDYNGTDNLYAVQKTDTSVWQITNAKYGVTDPCFSPKDNRLFFAQYSSQGFDIAFTSFEPLKWKKLEEVSDHSPKLYEASAKQEKFNFQDSIVPIKDYRVKNYSKLGHLVNVHSWAPFYYNYNNLDVNNTGITPGFSILSQDELSTCISSVGYSYNPYTPSQSFWSANVTYKGMFPVIDFSLAYGGEETVNSVSRFVPSVPNNRLHPLTDIYLPLNLTRGSYVTGITPSVQWEYNNDWFYNLGDSAYQQGMHYLSYSLYAYKYLRLSLRDLAPRWGITLSGRYTSTPFDNRKFNSIWYLKGTAYLPGIANHHSLQLSFGYQEQVPLLYIYSSYLAFPRGYNKQTTYTLQTFTSDYSFPIAYPDLAIGPVLYVKRIRGNLFFDMATNKYRDNRQKPSVWVTENLTSTGLDLTMDFHFLRILFPINTGVRMIYIPKTNQYLSQLLLNINLTNY